MSESKFTKELISFMQDKGFVIGPEPEIYGGVAGFYGYGPTGKLLKNKIEQSIRKVFTSNDFWETEMPIVLPDKVWEASGHSNNFKDPLVTCEKCQAIFRADKLIEEVKKIQTENLSEDEMLDIIKTIKCPSCKNKFQNKIEQQSLMMKTIVAGDGAALRPETATATYLPYKRFYKFFREKLPFAVFQIGKAFRNEISPRQHSIRGREFTQAEGQIFIDPKEKNKWDIKEIENVKLPLWDSKSQKSNKELKQITIKQGLSKKLFASKAYAWCVWLAYNQFISMGIPEKNIRIRQHHDDERAFYALDAWDIEIKLESYGWIEVCGVHDRGNHDLTQHSKHSGEKLTARNEKGEFIPHILEIAFGTDRPLMALLDIFYNKKSEKQGKTILKLPYKMAPIDVSIFPLMKKNKMPEKAKEVKDLLEDNFITFYDESGSIGRRYLRAAELGIPFCVTIDHQTLEDNTVTIRDRDTEKQTRVKINQIKDKLNF